MVRVHPDFVSHTGQRRKTVVEVTGERDGDMRSPEGGPDLEPSLLQIDDPVAAQQGEPFELVGAQVIDFSIIARIERRSPHLPQSENRRRNASA
jgi:hypothetical protein